ncbi:ATP-binding protein [Sorangium cellulosum]|uniref:ATP-binding protein n=1 Tax=Sorangium cellulosum TaxID=56 RepID=A0A4P2Q3Y4_SORCE|nr:AAA family ATPase [Sorangium cellulosum]AUX24064.1 ATP-binding protein [Sorangium cellulosum]
MIRSLHVENFTVFGEAELDFGGHLNVFVGENGTGKTHALKLAYAILATSWEEGRKPGAAPPTKAALQTRLADKLVSVFRPETLGRLARRRQGRERCDVRMTCANEAWDVSFSFSSQSKSDVTIDTLPTEWIDAAPAYLPTRELLTIYPGFVSVYENHYLEFDETWRDTCLLLGAPLKRGIKEKRIRELLGPLEEAMGGSIELDKNGRFYFRSGNGRMEMPLVAEGLRKLGMLARLIATGALLDKGCLFWDEPEANLNPRLIKKVASSIVELSLGGIQVFIATHSLFLLREIEMLLARREGEIDARFFGLHLSDAGVSVQQGPSVDDMGAIAALDEELEQSDRFLSPGD